MPQEVLENFGGCGGTSVRTTEWSFRRKPGDIILHFPLNRNYIKHEGDACPPSYPFP